MITDRRRDGGFRDAAEPGSNREGMSGHHRVGAAWPGLAAWTLVAIANFLALTGFRLPFAGAAIGCWFLIVQPVYLLCTTAFWSRTSMAERIGYSLTAVLLLLMVGGLVMNFALPPLGLARPLDTGPVVMLGDVLTAFLYALRWRYPARPGWRAGIRTLRWQESRLLVLGAVSVALAVLGTNRVNNNAGDLVSLIALGSTVVTLIFLLRWHRSVRDGMTSVTLYLVSLALLLMTSLRGSDVTGHDIQLEYRVFQLTAAHGRWSIASLRDAYNACLSITVLPTELQRVLGVDPVYVYKCFFEVLFAVCPVLVFALSRRHWSRFVGILAAIYFLGFPSFFTDMPFINRQAIAFLFVGAGMLAITNVRWSQATRRLILMVAGLGVELSHYSTMYVLVATLLIAWLVSLGLRSRRARQLMPESRTPSAPWAGSARTFGIGSVAVLACAILAWGGLATHTAGSAVTAARTSVAGLFEQSGIASPYSLLSGGTTNVSALLSNYKQSALRLNAADGAYVHVTSPGEIPTPVVTVPPLPLTGVGRALADAGVPVTTLNSVVRQSAAKDEQLFVIVGLIAFLGVRRIRRQLSREFVALGVASIVIVGVFTVFPNLSADYGGLRAFQEALIIIAPMLAVGSITVFSLFGRRWSHRWAAALCIGFFISTTGLMPQILGGYQAQLSLNNSGQYYDIYYQHPQEVAAVNWLSGKPGVLPAGVDAPLGPTTADRFAFTGPSDVSGSQTVGDIYPALITRSSWVLLDYAVVRSDQAVIYIDGQLIYYRYPVRFLEDNKNLVYSNGGSEIFR
jgi:uncharacterized membrane protein